MTQERPEGTTSQTESWFIQGKNLWRLVILIVALVAITGPWVFDRIWVPSEYSCSPPYIRLDGDYCGTPIQGVRLLEWMLRGLIEPSSGLVAGDIRVTEWAREMVFSLFVFLIVLPIITTALLILFGDRRRWRGFSLIAWGFSAGPSLMIGLSNSPKWFWILWGLWLYIAVTAAALVLEVLMLVRERKSIPGRGHPEGV